MKLHFAAAVRLWLVSLEIVVGGEDLGLLVAVLVGTLHRLALVAKSAVGNACHL
ncbi:MULTISPECIES: hypothetical protein [unclassified Variovorax]|uniref:hypothetical protein n=1 Tax=unclassified Variovorax TaxID=663243 RepID=UPI0015A4FBAF|nr:MULTISPECIES: hypothetical protein [unclassified Variovorax]